VYYNYTGNFLEDSEDSEIYEQTTIANQQGLDYSTLDKTKAEDEIAEQEWVRSCTIYLDLGYSIAFFLMILILEYKTSKNLKRVMVDYITPSDYSLEIRNLPIYTTEGEVALLFGGNFGEVEEVSFARYYDGVIGLYRDKAMLEMKIEREEIRCQIHRKTTSSSLKKLRKRNGKKGVKLRTKLPHLRDSSHLPVLRGYIVFNDVESKIRCAKAYSPYNGIFSCCMPQHLTLDGHALKYSIIIIHINQSRVFPTVEPSDINWENLEVSKCDKFGRSFLAFICVLILLLTSFAIIYLIKLSQETLPESKVCLQYEEATLQEMQTITDSERIYCFCSPQSKIDVNPNIIYFKWML
jgi:hypothetical protein